MQWVAENAWLVWLVLAGVLAVTETATLDFTLLMLAAGALAGATAAVFFPGLFWLQIAIALAVAVAMLALLRPTLLQRVRSAPGYRSSMDKMIGSIGTATSQITTAGGEAKVNGESWTARSVEGVIAEGSEIEVYQIDGAVAVVYPRHQALP
ncbi:NfeD family protein [Propionicimonas sp.]|uniref:NfeD family protein n=1 Tax=Propionicimonas sp. TaxID=1955623 RepID=UPI0017FFA6C6|nr:NfeD family protein [Propionicimonas sp.]MBU3977581.1 NfeD family protein [Actinomycetota bacterium]MBA3021506.1 NfeD family protein [Propionicimonas sp.]MBU3987055.1 NfeD family protein [Actinomycetota bacterium]MBU4008876.1 NfeD family protein [Actinomycetota bacterium]MBU4065974.1 NfeD family protein [Actinomycetota bacterium]